MNPKLRQFLSERGLSAADARKLGITHLPPAKTDTVIGWNCDSALIPYHDMDGKENGFRRFRRLGAVIGYDQRKKDPPKYIQEPGTRVRTYLPTTLKHKGGWRALAADPSIDLGVTEGEIKAATACKYDFPTIAIGGVWSFQERTHHRSLLPDFDEFDMNERRVYVIFDSDAQTNKQVQHAAIRLSRALANKGAHPYILYLPPHGELKTGLDDFLVREGRAKLLAELDNVECLIPDLGPEVQEFRDRLTMVEVLEKAYDSANHSFHSKRGLIDVHANRKVTTFNEKGTPKQVPAVEIWWESPLRRTATSTTTDPTKEPFSIIDIGEPYPNGYLNIWHGYQIEPVRGSVEPYLKMVSSLVPNKAERDYLLTLFAYWVQNPGIKTVPSVFLYGGQGIGKTALGAVLCDIWGPGARIIQDRDLFSDFNGWMAGTVFAMCNDLDCSTNRSKSRGQLKNYVENEEVEVNQKYEQSRKIRNCVNFYFNANSASAVPLDGTSDSNRRFFVLEGPKRPPLGEEWFLTIFDSWRRDGGAARLLHYLKQRSTKGFHPKASAPPTKARDAVTAISRTALEEWCASLDDVLPPHVELLTARQLWALYRGESSRADNTKLGTLTQVLAHFAHSFQPQFIDGEKVTLWAVRNLDRWMNSTTKDRAAQYKKQNPT